MMDTSGIMSPVMQYGFAGFCAVLLCMLFWAFRQLLVAFKSNTQAISQLTDRMAGDSNTIAKIFELLLGRPCMMEKKDQ